MKKCPACNNKLPEDINRKWLPFCSERCSLMDLGDWLGERHRIPAADADDLASRTEDEYTKH